MILLQHMMAMQEIDENKVRIEHIIVKRQKETFSLKQFKHF